MDVCQENLTSKKNYLENLCFFFKMHMSENEYAES